MWFVFFRTRRAALRLVRALASSFGSRDCSSCAEGASQSLETPHFLAAETLENWLEAVRYLNMDHLREHKS